MPSRVLTRMNVAKHSALRLKSHPAHVYLPDFGLVTGDPPSPPSGVLEYGQIQCASLEAWMRERRGENQNANIRRGSNRKMYPSHPSGAKRPKGEAWSSCLRSSSSSET
jgi:hypothetical protein